MPDSVFRFSGSAQTSSLGSTLLQEENLLG